MREQLVRSKVRAAQVHLPIHWLHQRSHVADEGELTVALALAVERLQTGSVIGRALGQAEGRALARRVDLSQVLLCDLKRRTGSSRLVERIIVVWDEQVVGVVSSEEEDANERLVIGVVSPVRRGEQIHQRQIVEAGSVGGAAECQTPRPEEKLSSRVFHGVTFEPGSWRNWRPDRGPPAPARCRMEHRITNRQRSFSWRPASLREGGFGSAARPALADPRRKASGW